MQEIDTLLEEQPEQAVNMVKLDSRNKLAHSELQAYNDHKIFVFKHPIVIQRKQYDEQLAELYELKRINPSALITEISNVTQNIRRIKSNINRKKYKSVDEKQSWEQNLSRAETRVKIIEEIIQ